MFVKGFFTADGVNNATAFNVFDLKIPERIILKLFLKEILMIKLMDTLNFWAILTSIVTVFVFRRKP